MCVPGHSISLFILWFDIFVSSAVGSGTQCSGNVGIYTCAGIAMLTKAMVYRQAAKNGYTINTFQF